MKHTATREIWAERVRRWRNSGLSSDAFADREGCNRHTFRNWRKKLESASRLPLAAPPGFVEVMGSVITGRKQSNEAMLPFEVTLMSGARVVVPARFDAGAFETLIAVLDVH